MPSNNRELIKEIFYEATQLPQAQKDRYVENRCHNDPELLNEVISLLESYNKSKVFFNDLSQSLLGIEIEDDIQEDDNISDPYEIIGTLINHYTVISKLGDGGMGIVYKAHDNRLNREVALKFLPPHLLNSTQAVKRFKKEAITASKIDHPNIGTIYSVETTTKNIPFISMAYYQGETLENILAEENLAHQSIIKSETLNILSQIAEGLRAAHAKNIIHRDIKPANIIRLPDGSIKILDFGLAKVCDENLTQSGIKMGTIAYMSPEHIRGDELDERSDIWSFGVLSFEIIANHKPFTGTSEQSLMFSVLNDQPDYSLLKADYSIKKIIQKCLQRTINNRYQTMQELQAQLNKARLEKNNNLKIFNFFSELYFISTKRWIKSVTIVGILLMCTWGVFYVQDNLKISEKRTISLYPKVMGIALFSPHKKLSEVQLGIIESISQGLISTSHNNSNIWAIPFKKTQEYNIDSLLSAREIFGVNILLEIDFLLKENKDIIQLSLIHAKNLQPIKSIQIEKNSINTASLQEKINTAVISLLNLKEQSFQHSIKMSTSNPEAYAAYLHALGLLLRPDEQYNLESSIEYLNKSLKYDPEFIQAKDKLAYSFWLLYQETKESTYAARSEKIYQEILLTLPNNVSSYLSLGKLHTLQGKYGTALASYQLAIQYEPYNSEIFEGIANVYEKTGKIELAENFLIKAMQMKPDNWDGYNDLGAFYLNQGRYKDAISSFEKVIQLTPKNAWAYNNLAAAYWYSGNIDNAIDYFEKSLIIRDDYSSHKNLATLYFHEKKYSKAIDSYLKAIELNHNDYELWGNLAGAYYYSNKETELVMKTFQQAIKLAQNNFSELPDDFKINANLAAYYAWTENSKLAEKHLAKILNLESFTVSQYFQVATIYALLSDSDNAFSWIKKALDNGYPKDYILNSPDFNQLISTEKFKNLIANYN